MPRSRSRGRSSRSSSRVKNNVWAVTLVNEQLITTGFTNIIDIVTASDWTQFGERATILTVRGWLSCCANNDAGAKNEGQVNWYIGVMDTGITGGAVPGPFVASTYVASNILSTGGHLYENQAANNVGPRNTVDWDIHLKTMRTVRANESLRLIAENGTGDDIRFGGIFRALLRKGGN